MVDKKGLISCTYLIHSNFAEAVLCVNLLPGLFVFADVMWSCYDMSGTTHS